MWRQLYRWEWQSKIGQERHHAVPSAWTALPCPPLMRILPTLKDQLNQLLQEAFPNLPIPLFSFLLPLPHSYMLRIYLDFLYNVNLYSTYSSLSYLSVFGLLCLDLSVFVSHINCRQLEGGDQALPLYTSSTRHGALHIEVNSPFAYTIPFAQETLPYSPPPSRP